MLDVLTGGRFTLGVGRGGPWVDLEVFGTGMEGLSHQAFEEALDILAAWGSQEAVSYTGKFHRFREVPVVPRGGPPIVVACTSSETVRVAADRRLPMLLGMHADDAEKAAMVREYGPPADHVAVLLAQVEDSRTAGVSLLRQTMPAWLTPGLAGFVRFDGAEAAMRDPVAYTERLTAIHPVGSADYCVERILECERVTGIDRFLLLVEGGGPENTLANIKALGASVLPPLRAA
jgi:alkanesulfonate monooxygenase SsuD/methylene tetrahydromethanopterin reductase-like flavin-dependent oxidoreductase (luciferase family)